MIYFFVGLRLGYKKRYRIAIPFFIKSKIKLSSDVELRSCNFTVHNDSYNVVAISNS